MSRTVYYDTDGNEITYEEYCYNNNQPFMLYTNGKEDKEENDSEESTNDAPTYAQEQLECLEGIEAVDKAVNHPLYYKKGGIEAIDVIEAWNLDFCLGNTVKYIARCGRKSDKVLEDLKKAAWYLNREIERVKNKKERTNE